MKIIYIDESGKNKESPFAVLCGISFDYSRMRKTKDAWLKFIKWLNKQGIKTSEMHIAQFFVGNGLWYKLKDEKRKSIIKAVIKWINYRAHEFCVVSAKKKRFSKTKDNSLIIYKNIWFFLATHLIFSFSKRYQNEKGVKGDFIAIFDKGCIGDAFNNFILSDEANDLFKEYVGIETCSIKLGDAPLSANSKYSSLIQIADFIVFFVRRKIELDSGMKEKYKDEKKDINNFYNGLSKNKINQRYVYKRRCRSDIEEKFYVAAPDSLKK